MSIKNPEAFAAVTVAASIASSAVGYAMHDVADSGAIIVAAVTLAIVFGFLGYAAADRS